MHKFTRSLLTEWRRLGLPFEGEAVVVAVSGGADSVSLLLALADLEKRKKLTNELIVAHFDHGLRGEASEADADFVRGLAGDVGLKFVGGMGKIAAKGNLEQNARRARYAFLEKTAADADAFAVVTGHTMNDQAETFLFNLLRGSGAAGLAAMPPMRALTDGTETLLVRPMLRWAHRANTEDFCRDMDVEPRKDAMNEDPSFTRVRIRKEVIPLLAEMNPKVVDAIAQAANLLRESSNPGIAAEAEKLMVAELARLDDAAVQTVIREWLGIRRGNLRGLTLKHIGAIVRLVKSRKSGRVAELPRGERVIKRGGRLIFTTDHAVEEA
ncbi:MAG TPA: tRNA lysidine(34) synthetase TilS [Pyrinomonadaceae bacterium]|nr:tRNA lysidine(34) synthetase TilS [Pyrinomonadaceae bacterium]